MNTRPVRSHTWLPTCTCTEHTPPSGRCGETVSWSIFHTKTCLLNISSTKEIAAWGEIIGCGFPLRLFWTVMLSQDDALSCTREAVLNDLQVWIEWEALVKGRVTSIDFHPPISAGQGMRKLQPWSGSKGRIGVGVGFALFLYIVCNCYLFSAKVIHNCPNPSSPLLRLYLASAPSILYQQVWSHSFVSCIEKSSYRSPTLSSKPRQHIRALTLCS